MMDKRKEEIKKIVPRLRDYNWKENELRYQKAIVDLLTNEKKILYDCTPMIELYQSFHRDGYKNAK